MNPPIPTGRIRRLGTTVLYGVLASNLAALSAHAADLDAPQVKVTFGDLDLSRSPGAIELYSRIKSAAKKVCAPYWATSLQARVSADDCVRSAIAQAVATVDRPALSQVYGAKHRQPLPSRLSLQTSRVAM